MAIHFENADTDLYAYLVYPSYRILLGTIKLVRDEAIEDKFRNLMKEVANKVENVTITLEQVVEKAGGLSDWRIVNRAIIELTSSRPFTLVIPDYSDYRSIALLMSRADRVITPSGSVVKSRDAMKE